MCFIENYLSIYWLVGFSLHAYFKLLHALCVYVSLFPKILILNKFLSFQQLKLFLFVPHVF